MPKVSTVNADTTPQIQESQRIPVKINIKISTIRLIFKLQKIKDKENILKKEKHITYRGMRLRIAYDFSSETMQAVRERNEALKLLKEKNPANYNSVSSKTMLQK